MGHRLPVCTGHKTAASLHKRVCRNLCKCDLKFTTGVTTCCNLCESVWCGGLIFIIYRNVCNDKLCKFYICYNRWCHVDCYVQSCNFCQWWAKLPFLGRLWMTSTAAWKRLWQSSVSDIVRAGISYGLYLSHTPSAECSLTGQPVNYIHWCHSAIIYNVQKSSLGRNCILRLLVRHLWRIMKLNPPIKLI